MGILAEKPHDIGLDSKSSTERDRIDLNHEISGEETGRIQRFLSAFTGAAQIESEKTKSERRYHSMLHMLLMEDAGYAQLYYAVEDKVNKAYQAVGQALVDIKQRLLASEQRLEILRDQTAQLDDETIVFLSYDGFIYTEDGQRVKDEDARNITIPENAPSWESYKGEKEKHEALLRDQKEIEDYKTDVLDSTRDKLNNEDDPPSLEELEKIERDIQTQRPDSLATYFYDVGLTSNQEQPQNPSVAQGITESEIPSTRLITSDFDKARLDIPDLNELPQIMDDPVPVQKNVTP